jgi:hypothetical protein
VPLSSKRIFERLARRYRTPLLVQALLAALPYNKDNSMRSAAATWKCHKAHCLEGALLAAAILEQRGYPPLVLSLDSADELGHVLFVFHGPRGWGAVGKSRDEGLSGRAPIFRSVRDLAWSYADPYVDETGRLTGYALANLDAINARWRDSPRNVWRVENWLIDFPHHPMRMGDARYRRSLAHYRKNHTPARRSYWW